MHSHQQLGMEKSKIPRAVPIAKVKKHTAANGNKSDVINTDKIKVQSEEIPTGKSAKEDNETTSPVSTSQSGKFQFKVYFYLSKFN